MQELKFHSREIEHQKLEQQPCVEKFAGVFAVLLHLYIWAMSYAQVDFLRSFSTKIQVITDYTLTLNLLQFT
jgi:ABC-type phosphate/phosphonate transport system permease subunit